MQILLGALIVLVALTALARLTGSSRLRHALRGLFGEALPGARTGGAVPSRTGPASRTSARLEWTEVVNLTAAGTASRPRRNAEREAETRAEAR